MVDDIKKRKRLSGSQYLKKRLAREKDLVKQKGSLLKFCQQNSQENVINDNDTDDSEENSGNKNIDDLSMGEVDNKKKEHDNESKEEITEKKAAYELIPEYLFTCTNTVELIPGSLEDTPIEVIDCFTDELMVIRPTGDNRIEEFMDYVFDNYISPEASFPPSIWAQFSTTSNRTTNSLYNDLGINSYVPLNDPGINSKANFDSENENKKEIAISTISEENIENKKSCNYDEKKIKMSRIIRVVKETFNKYPMIANATVYGTMSVGAEFSQQILTKRILNKTKPQEPIDINLLGRYAIVGTLISPNIVYLWQNWLDKAFVSTAPKIILKKILLNQFILTPPLYVASFVSMSLLEGKKDLLEECRQKFIPTFKISCMFWLPAQVIKFTLVPPAAYANVDRMCSFVWLNILCWKRRNYNTAIKEK
ncbi:hypothetical protein QTP88_003478 [Uroleucon formosanum]